VSAPGTVANAVAGAVAGIWHRLRDKKGAGKPAEERPENRAVTATGTAELPSGLEARAEQEVTSYLEAQGGALERAERLREKAERLEADGTPSESAQNRALRALEEVEVGLKAFRAKFVRSAPDGSPSQAARAFDRALERRGLL
jgi:hypothetical protein